MDLTGRFEHGNELSGSIKCGKFLGCLNDYQLLKGLCSMEGGR